MIVQMQQRRGTAAEWTTVNPVLADGEMGLESDTGKFKFGNGVQTWSARPYATTGSGGGGGGGVTVENLPAGSVVMVKKTGTTWPARPTTRTDLVVVWQGTEPSPPIVTSGTGGMYSGDERDIIV